MKTITKKTLINLLTVVFAFSFLANPIFAQEEEEKTIKIKKVMKSEDGTEVVIDTTFTVKDLKDLENMDVMLGDELIEDIDIKLQDLDDLDDLDVDIFVSDEDGTEEKHIIMVKRKGDEDGESMQEIMSEYKYIVGEGDSTKVIELKISGDGDAIFISDDGEIKTIETDGGEQKIIIKKCKDGEDISIIYSDDAGWEGEHMINIEVEDSEDGKKVIIKEENGEVKEYMIEGDEGAYMIDEEDVFVNVMKTKDGDKTTIIKTKCIVKSLNEEDKKNLEKAGIEVAPKSDNNKLEMEKLSFHPNPSNGKFTLKFNTEQEGDTDIKIYDINGKEVYNERIKDFDGKYEKEIDISENGSGTYFLKVSQGDKMMTRKIILE
ncbi:MAG: T9SS type A sorting domain-containing protein [Bacteroidales bacterium]|nr:T9SS type A sorting domain-containing protein [Bacteroidales bacterium]